MSKWAFGFWWLWLDSFSGFRYQGCDGGGGPHGGKVDDVAGDLGLAPVLEEVDVEVDGAVEGGQQVAGAGHVG